MVFVSDCQGVPPNTAARQDDSSCMETVSNNAIHRAANSNESAAQRAQRQQASIASQLQHIEGELPHSTIQGPLTSRDHEPRRSGVADGLLCGVGSRFGATHGSAR